MALQNRVTIGTKFGKQMRLLAEFEADLTIVQTTDSGAPANTAGNFGINHPRLVNPDGDRRDYNDGFVRLTAHANPLFIEAYPIVDFDPSSGTVYLENNPQPGPVTVNDSFEIWHRFDPATLPTLTNRGLRRCREVTEIILMDTNDIYQCNAYSLPLAGLKKTLLRIPPTTTNLLTAGQSLTNILTEPGPDRTPSWNALNGASLAVQALPIPQPNQSQTTPPYAVLYNFHDVQEVSSAIAVTTPGAVANEGIETNFIPLNPKGLETLTSAAYAVNKVTSTVGVTGANSVFVSLLLYDVNQTLLSTTTFPNPNITTQPVPLPGGTWDIMGGGWLWLIVPNANASGAAYAKLQVYTGSAQAGTFYVSAPQVEPTSSATPWALGGTVRQNPQIDTGAAIRDYYISVTGDVEHQYAMLHSNARYTENGAVELRWGDAAVNAGRVITLMTRTPFYDLTDDATQVNIADDYIISAMGVEYYLAMSDMRESGVRGDTDRQYARWVSEFNRLHKRYAPQISARRRLLH